MPMLQDLLAVLETFPLTVVPGRRDRFAKIFYGDVGTGSRFPEPLVKQLVAVYQHQTPERRLAFIQEVAEYLRTITFDRRPSLQELQYYLLDRIYFNWYLALDLPEYPDLLPFVFAYDDQGRRIYLQRSLGIQPDQRIYRRVLYNQLGEPVRDVVVKWVSEDLGDFGEEPTKWLQVESRGVDLPWFATQFQFWGEPAFVTELLEPITTADDPLAIGRTVLETIRRIHGLGVHNDIKPDNILARTEPDGRRSYFLIDWARMTTEPKLYGFERFTFSPP